MKLILGLSCAALAAVTGVLSVDSEASSAGRFTLHGTVTAVIDGDTVDVRLTSGSLERVRLIGIDAPERGACLASRAATAARDLAYRRHVILKGDAAQDTRDRYGRLLAYVWLPGGQDLGFQLLRRGVATVYVFERPFARLAAYRHAEAQGSKVGDAACGRGCHPSYPTLCLSASVSDYDCFGGSGNGPRYVKAKRFPVRPPDPFGLDGDGDRIGCER